MVLNVLIPCSLIRGRWVRSTGHISLWLFVRWFIVDNQLYIVVKLWFITSWFIISFTNTYLLDLEGHHITGRQVTAKSVSYTLTEPIHHADHSLFYQFGKPSFNIVFINSEFDKNNLIPGITMITFIRVLNDFIHHFLSLNQLRYQINEIARNTFKWVKRT